MNNDTNDAPHIAEELDRTIGPAPGPRPPLHPEARLIDSIHFTRSGRIVDLFDVILDDGRRSLCLRDTSGTGSHVRLTYIPEPLVEQLRRAIELFEASAGKEQAR